MQTYHHTAPVKEYKTTISTMIGVGLYASFIALLVWIIIAAFSWLMLLCTGMLACFFGKQMVYYFRCRHEKIVITEQQLAVTQCVKQTCDGDWIPVKNIKIPWDNINYIAAQWEHPTSKSIRKNVLVGTKKKDTYLIDPDIFDVFFLEKKLQDYHHLYGNKRQSHP